MRLRDIGGTAPCANPLTTPSHILQDKSSLSGTETRESRPRFRKRALTAFHNVIARNLTPLWAGAAASGTCIDIEHARCVDAPI